MLAALPDAEERISYQIPTFAVDGQYVIYIAGWKNHVSIYPIPGGTRRWMPTSSRTSRARAPSSSRSKQPVPWDLVDRAIAAQVAARVPQIRR